MPSPVPPKWVRSFVTFCTDLHHISYHMAFFNHVFLSLEKLMLNKGLAIKEGCLIPADILYLPSAVGILVAAKDARILICQVCEPARLPHESELGLLIR